ncbi:MAG: TonB-dependent receptor [Chitinophagales bacterium]
MFMKIGYLMAWLPLITLAQQPADSTQSIISADVVVTANRAATNDPTTKQTVTAATLQKNNFGQDLPYLLDQTPALVTTSDAGTGIGYTGLRIRGTDASRINVTINGVPINDAESQQMYWVDMPDIASSTNDIQIQRGVGSSTNGSGAFGASVNVRTQTASLRPFAAWSSSFGSFATQKHTIKAGTGFFGKYFFVEGRASMIRSNGYVDRASANLWSYWVAAGFMYKQAMLRFVHFNGQEKTYQSWYGTPQDSLTTNRRFNLAGTDYGANPVPWNNQVDRYGQQYFQLIYTQGIGKKWALNITPFVTLGKGYYEEFKVQQELSRYKVTDTTAYADVIRRRWLNNKFFGTVFSLRFEDKKWQATLGGMAAQYEGKHYGTVFWAQQVAVNPNQHYYDSRSHKTDANIYLKANYQPVQWLNIYADVQYRFVQHLMKGNDNDGQQFDLKYTYHFFNPKAGVTFHLSKTSSAYASYAQTTREPSRDDFISNLNQVAPKPERLHDIEAGYVFTDHWHGLNWQVSFPFQANVYYMHYQNQLVVTGKLNDVGNPVRVNVPISYRAGLEWWGQMQLRHGRDWLHLNYQLAFNYSRIKNYSAYIPAYDENYTPVPIASSTKLYKNTAIAFSPNWVLGIEPEIFPVKGLSAAWSFKYISRQYLDNTQSNDRAIPAYWYSNLRFSYTLPFFTRWKKTDQPITKNGEVRFNFLVTNLFNKQYVSNGYTYREIYQSADGTVSGPYHYNYYYPQAGVAFYGGIDLRF